MDTNNNAAKILVVGSGAIGQVFAYHLQKGGAKVTFFVKPKHLEACRKGFNLYPLSGMKKGSRLELKAEALSDVSQVAAQTWDFVWLCIPSTGLKGEWLDDLVQATAGATFVTTQPGPDDREYLLTKVPATRLISGAIAFMAAQTPLPGEERSLPGVAFYFPIGSASVFSGPDAEVTTAVALLKQGGLPARIINDANAAQQTAGAVLMPWIAGLEINGWSIAEFMKSPWRERAVRAASQALATLDHQDNAVLPTLLSGVMFSRTSVSIGKWLASRLLPVPIETYLQFHFTKTAAQTRTILQTFVKRAQSRDLPHDDIEALLAELPALENPKSESSSSPSKKRSRDSAPMVN